MAFGLSMWSSPTRLSFTALGFVVFDGFTSPENHQKDTYRFLDLHPPHHGPDERFDIRCPQIDQQPDSLCFDLRFRGAQVEPSLIIK